MSSVRQTVLTASETRLTWSFVLTCGRYPLSSRKATEENHACPFADTLATAVINAFTAPGDLVCDPYSGSGTTMCAAQAMGRSFVGTEISKDYHRQSIERLQMQRMEVA